jgi:hypothetical protein
MVWSPVNVRFSTTEGSMALGRGTPSGATQQRGLTPAPGRSGGGRSGPAEAEVDQADSRPAVAGAGGVDRPELVDQALFGGLLVQLGDALGGDLAGESGLHFVLLDCLVVVTV